MNDLKEIKDYCLNCPNKPCSKQGCPLGNDIPGFIHEENDYEAFKILSKTTVIPAICGRICPHSKQCKGSCVRSIKGEAVQIGNAEAYIGDISIREKYEIPRMENEELFLGNNLKNKKTKIAVIGSGPCGLTCSAFLARNGVEVTIFEKYKQLGGLLRHGIPDFRLDRNIIEQTISKILKLGIKVETEKELGKDIFLTELLKQFDCVFISIGANKSNETLKGNGVIKGNEFLEQFNVTKEEIEKELGFIIKGKEPIENSYDSYAKLFSDKNFNIRKI